MDRETFLKTVGLGTAALALPGCTTRLLPIGRQKPRNPNIIFIMTDDMGYGDVSCYNPESKIHTPHMDKLAAEGIRFTDAHTPSAVCTPTRYGVLTGRYTWRGRLKRGVFGGFNRPLIEHNRMTVASFLQAQDYQTACVGKWHLGMDWTLKEGEDPEDQDQFTVDFTGPQLRGPNDVGFDYFFGTAGCTTDDPPLCFIENRRTVGIPDEVLPYDFAGEDRTLLMVPGWRHEDADVEFLNRSITFIEDHVSTRPNDPFFLYLPLSVPHIPWLPPDFVKGKSGAGLRGDQVVLADWILGQLLENLDRLNLNDNTLVILTSDNGPREGINGHRSAGDLRGLKGSIWEGGHRVPFIARWPGKTKPGSVSAETICLTDLLMTSAAIVGADVPDAAAEDSYNILPALLGEAYSEPIREATVHHSGSGVFAIRQGDWKLIVGTKSHGADDAPDPDSSGQLYNLADDPGEQRDLWDERQDVVAHLSQLLESYQRKGRSRRPAS
jgi:arylsulfatase A-like enzyme